MQTARPRKMLANAELEREERGSVCRPTCPRCMASARPHCAAEARANTSSSSHAIAEVLIKYGSPSGVRRNKNRKHNHKTTRHIQNIWGCPSNGIVRIEMEAKSLIGIEGPTPLGQWSQLVKGQIPIYPPRITISSPDGGGSGGGV